MDTLKFGLCLYVLTYVGAWFNALTLVILAWIAVFTLPLPLFAGSNLWRNFPSKSLQITGDKKKGGTEKTTLPKLYLNNQAAVDEVMVHPERSRDIWRMDKKPNLALQLTKELSNELTKEQLEQSIKILNI